MAISWLKDVIDNSKYADTATVTLSSGEMVNLGDIRNLTKAQQKALTDREAALNAKEADLQRNLKTLQDAQAETARLFTDIQEQKSKSSRRDRDDRDNAPDPMEALTRDPILGPIAQAVKQLQTTYDEIKTKALSPIAKAQQEMAAAYVQDRIEDLYERLVPEAKKASVSLEAVLKVATDNGYKTRTGIPDIKKAYQHISTKPITQEDMDAQLAAAKEEGRKEAAEAARLRVPRPMGSGGGRPEIEGGFKPKNVSSVSHAFDEAFAAAAKDADIWAQVDSGNSN